MLCEKYYLPPESNDRSDATCRGKRPSSGLPPDPHRPPLPQVSGIMAENDETILGKREREEGADRDEPMNPAGGDDSSDDEVGPMPLPAGAQGAAKKKRKGRSLEAFNWVKH